VVETIGANPKIPTFIMHELSQGGGNVKDILTRIVDRYGMSLPQRMFGLIEQEVKAGTIRPVDAPQLMLTLLGSCIYYFVAEPMIVAILDHVQPQTDRDRGRFLEQRKESIFDVIYYGLKIRPQEREE